MFLDKRKSPIYYCLIYCYFFYSFFHSPLSVYVKLAGLLYVMLFQWSLWTFAIEIKPSFSSFLFLSDLKLTRLKTFTLSQALLFAALSI